MPDPSSISRRESLKRAAGALALGLGAPVTLAATTDTVVRLSFYKRDAREPFHSMRLSEADAKAFHARGLGYIKFDGVDGEVVERTVGLWTGKECCPR